VIIVTPDQLRSEFQAALAAASTVASVKAIRDEYLSRKQGKITALLKAVGTASPDERRVLGAQANALKQEIESALDARESAFELHANGGLTAWRGRLRRGFESYNELANGVLRQLSLAMPEIDLSSIPAAPI